jgi:soluble lytic murein transglycosylase
VERRLYLLAGLLLALGLLAATLDWDPVLAEARFRTRVERVESHAEVLRQAAAETGQDPYLLAGLVYVESGGDPAAVSSVDALGLFQVRLATAAERAEELGLPAPMRKDLLEDTLQNARLGAAYLAWLRERSDGNLERALISYNAGPTKVDAWVEEAGGWDAWHAERRAAKGSALLRYASDVLSYAERFRRRGHIAPPAAGSISASEDGFARPPGSERTAPDETTAADSSGGADEPTPERGSEREDPENRP